MTTAELEEMADAAERVLEVRGFIRIARPPVQMTEQDAETMLRRFYSVVEHLELSVEKQPDGSIVAYGADLPETERERIRMTFGASLN